MYNGTTYIPQTKRSERIETPADKLIRLLLYTRKATSLPDGAFGLQERLLFCLLAAPQPPRELMESLGMAKSNLALLAKKCIGEGLIDKTTQNGDRRTILYALTEKGRTETQKRLSAINEKFATVLPDDNARGTALATLDAANELLSFVP